MYFINGFINIKIVLIMRKKYFLSRLAIFGLLTLGTTTTFVGCSKDYDDDIANLQTQITANTKAISDIQTLLNSGQWVKSVTSVTNGVTITLGNGTAYTITNGATGATGAAGTSSVITIGTNGNWFVNGVDTGKTSVGATGATGATGAYYVPNVDGYWHKIDGTTDTKTTQKWLPDGTITAIDNGEYVTLYNVQGITGGIAKLPKNDKALRGMVFVPQLYYKGVPAMNFSSFAYKALLTNSSDGANPISSSATTTNTPQVKVQYNLNPSGVTLSQVDTANVAFISKVVQTKVAMASFKPQNFKVTEGVLEFNVKTNSANFATGSNIDILALQVPLTNTAQTLMGAQGTVTSDYATVYNETETADKLLIGNQSNPSTLYAGSFEEAKSSTPVEVVYNKAKDLKTIVGLYYGTQTSYAAFSNNFGFTYQFDMLDWKGNALVYNEGINPVTDQQNFASLDGSVLNSKVYEQTGAAAIGRTPIVRVKLVDPNNNNAIVKVAYIKFKFVVQNTDPITINSEIPAFTFNSHLGDQIMNVDAQYMNYIYNKAGLSKENFYSFYYATLPAGVTQTNLSGGQPTQTSGLKWTLSEDQIWNTNANLPTATFASNEIVFTPYSDTRPVIKITLNAIETRPNITINSLVTNFWDSGLMKLAVATPNLTVPVTAFDKDMSLGFKTNVSGQLVLDGITSGFSDYNNITNKYYFNKNSGKNVPVGGFTFDIRNNNTELWATEDGINYAQVAVISGSMVSYKNNTIANKLLNSDNAAFDIIVVGNLAGTSTRVVGLGDKGQFKVKFIRPIYAKNLDVTIKDKLTAGSTFTALSLVKLFDYTNTEFTFTPTNYYSYYGVTDVNVDTNGITTSIGKSVNQPESELFVSSAGMYPFTTLTYKNTGSLLSSGFTMDVPVTVKYAWGSTVTTHVTVAVQP